MRWATARERRTAGPVRDVDEDDVKGDDEGRVLRRRRRRQPAPDWPSDLKLEVVAIVLTADELLSTTRTVRRRLDLTRPVERDLLEECFDLALQAPTGGNQQGWHFVLVTKTDDKRAISDLYRRSKAENDPPSTPAEHRKVMDSSAYLAEHLHEVPVLVIPCVEGRTEGASHLVQAVTWGSILPATWSFMLAARARGLGTAWTSLHLQYEREVAELLEIPFEQVMQVALIPIAHTIGADFRPGPRRPTSAVVHWDRW
jgi:nitroreductase